MSRREWYWTVYLKSDQWRLKRQEKLQAEPKCEVCRSKQHLEIHHRTYARLGSELLSDLVTLCRPCHRTQHGKPRPKPKARKVKPKKKRGRKGEAFASYAWHCLRMIRSGTETAEQRAFLKANQSAIQRLQV